MKTVKIGEQVWSMENLDVDHYRNGDVIPEVKNPDDWENLTTGAWCYYENNSEIGKKHGKLYNWYAVADKRGLAPKGYHIPTNAEFMTLRSAVENSDSLKAEGEGIGDSVGTNKSGFSALLTGCRYYDGYFNNLGYDTFYWSSNENNDSNAYYMYLYNYTDDIHLSYYSKANGYNVRTIKDKKMETVKIGEQVWSTENLDVEHYRNGDVIPEVKDPDDWENLESGAWCYYGNNSEIGKKHGKLYNWYAVADKRGLAPSGYHIPTREEFEILASTVNNGNSLKAEGEGIGTWEGVGTNKSGFSALLSGYRDYDGNFYNLGNYINFCSSTEFHGTDAYSICLDYISGNSPVTNYAKGSGFSIRVIKNE